MPDFEDDIGASIQIYVPDDDVQIDNGYTHIRIYWATSQTATATQETDIALVSGQGDYEYVKSDALETDWWEWCLFDGSTEGPRSERFRVGPLVCTKKEIRRAAGRRLRVMRKVGTVLASPTPTTTAFASTNLIDADASSHKYANALCRFSSGNQAGETRRIRNETNSGYAPTTGVLTTNPFSGAPSAGDEFEIWHPKEDDDTDALMDEAVEWAATRLYWPAAFYFTFDSNVEEYQLPMNCMPQVISDVHVARGTYPSRPEWRPVSRWHARMEVSGPVITLQGASYWSTGFAQGDIIQVLYAASAETLPSDSSRVYVNVKWAAAEAAMTFLDHLGVPGGGLESIIDAERAKGSLQRDLVHYRRKYMPEPRVIQELAR